MENLASRESGFSTARSDRLGSVHSIDRVVMTVPNLSEAKSFFEAFGLRCIQDTVGAPLDIGTCGHPHVWLTLLPGAKKQLLYVRYGAYVTDYIAIQERVASLHLSGNAPHERALEVTGTDGLWLTDPDGVQVQIVVAGKSSPDFKTRLAESKEIAAGKGAAPSRSTAPKVHPRYLSHVLFFTADVQKALDFYVGVLGLRLSDRSEMDIAFLHGAYGSDHHLAAFVKADGPGVHHLSWDVGSVHEVGLGSEQMRRNGYTRGWGVGRHVLGSNYFYYVRDPWGSYAEYSFDIDYIPADLDWPAANHPGEDSFYVWGPEPPQDFATNYEVPREAGTAMIDAGKIN
ncbi:VOC family protein [Paraburkholderia sp. J41]|uniref:VOC family protein n=1 Tax=Paraburkholderia sp. J41 TaxID=2805433 RepID=UPI002AC33FB8|nr:VOC family protein [Paraburkholderia sp. J41]